MPDSYKRPGEIQKSALNDYMMHVHVPRPLFESPGTIQWRQNQDGGDVNTSHTSSVLAPDVPITTLAASYKAQLLAAKWIVSDELVSDTCIWQALSFQDEEGAQWKGFFLFAKHAEIDDACLFYARIDRVIKKEKASNFQTLRHSKPSST